MGARARLAVGGEGRGITRPARSRRQGRPGKPLAPVKRPALRGGTGGSQSGRALARPTKAGAYGLSESPGASARAHRARASIDILLRWLLACRSILGVSLAGTPRVKDRHPAGPRQAGQGEQDRQAVSWLG